MSEKMAEKLKSQNESCWNRIGVWRSGTERCAELDVHVHCQNCPVFVKSGSELFDAEMPSDYLDEWTSFLAERRVEEEGDRICVLIFRIGSEHYALRAGIFREIASMRRIYRIPHRTDELMLGMANVRGEIRLCFSLGALFGLGTFAQFDSTSARILLIESNGIWAFPVDQSLGVFMCDDKKDANVPVTVAKASGSFTQKMLVHEGLQIGLLDHELLTYTLLKRMS